MKLISHKLFHDYYISYGNMWSVIFAATIATADVAEIVRKLEVEPQDATESCSLMIKRYLLCEKHSCIPQ